MSFEEQPFEGASAFNSDNGIMAELGEYPASGTGMGLPDYAMEMDLGGGIINKRHGKKAEIFFRRKRRTILFCQWFEADVSGSLGSGRYSGSDKKYCR